MHSSAIIKGKWGCQTTIALKTTTILTAPSKKNLIDCDREASGEPRQVRCTDVRLYPLTAWPPQQRSGAGTRARWRGRRGGGVRLACGSQYVTARGRAPR